MLFNNRADDIYAAAYKMICYSLCLEIITSVTYHNNRCARKFNFLLSYYRGFAFFSKQCLMRSKLKKLSFLIKLDINSIHIFRLYSKPSCQIYCSHAKTMSNKTYRSSFVLERKNTALNSRCRMLGINSIQLRYVLFCGCKNSGFFIIRVSKRYLTVERTGAYCIYYVVLSLPICNKISTL